MSDSLQEKKKKKRKSYRDSVNIYILYKLKTTLLHVTPPILFPALKAVIFLSRYSSPTLPTYTFQRFKADTTRLVLSCGYLSISLQRRFQTLLLCDEDN